MPAATAGVNTGKLANYDNISLAMFHGIAEKWRRNLSTFHARPCRMLHVARVAGLA
jgi:hypothetical protein